MIVLGVDAHEFSHTATAVDLVTDRPLATIRIETSLAD